MRIPVLVTGGAGMLGLAFAEQGSINNAMEVRALPKAVLDVRDMDQVMAWADWVEGGWIIHCAATVDVQACARDPEAARQTLVDGARNVSVLARAANARLFYPQSFLVYEGGQDPIAECTEPAPLSLYGELKWEAEQIIRDAQSDALVVRMAGFFGGDDADKNFVGRIIPVMHRAMMGGAEVFEVGDRVWQPTWTRDLAENSLYLMQAQRTGVYQMSSHGHAAFHEVASQIVEALGWGARFRIQPVPAADVAAAEAGPERRPDRAVLGCERLKRENADMQRDWRSTLNAYLASPFFNQYRLEE